MTTKENPQVVGEMPCFMPNCSCIAEVRQRESGKKLKYLYCPDHKLVQASGDDLQKRITENMAPVGTLKEAEPVNDDGKDDTEQTEINQPNSETWRPQGKKLEEKTEPQTKITAMHVVCGLGVCAVVGVGVWYFLRKKPNEKTEIAPAEKKAGEK